MAGEFSLLPPGMETIGGRAAADVSLENALRALVLWGTGTGAQSGDAIPTNANIKVLVQMGYNNYTFNSAGAGIYDATLTLPRAFPGGCIGAFASLPGTAGSLIVMSASKTALSLRGPVSGSRPVFWMAFGW